MNAAVDKHQIPHPAIAALTLAVAGTTVAAVSVVLFAGCFMLTTWPFEPAPRFGARPWILASVLAGMMTIFSAAMTTLGVVTWLRNVLKRHTTAFALIILVLTAAVAVAFLSLCSLSTGACCVVN